jgi:23S rRNA (pseudouridine1915-N3)-methyltransferase
LAVGQRQPDWVNDAVADYLNRFPENQRPQLKEIKAESRTARKPVTMLLQAEASRLRNALPKDAILVALDEHGQNLETLEFANLLERNEQRTKNLVFLIGGPDGLDKTLKESCNYRIRISSLTLPHGLARILLVEQLYRIQLLKMRHPYHRGDTP